MTDEAPTDTAHWSAYWKSRQPERQHHRWVKLGGSVVVTVPNFRRLNGAFQRRFNADTLATRNLELVHPETLARALARTGEFESAEAFYYGPFRAWFEPGASAFARTVLVGVLGVGTVLDRFVPRTSLTARNVVATGRTG